MPMIIDKLDRKREALLVEKERIAKEIDFQKAGNPNQYPEDYGRVSGSIKRKELSNNVLLAANNVARKVVGSFLSEDEKQIEEERSL